MRGRVAEVTRRHDLRAGSEEAIERLLATLAAEPDPPTTVRDPLAAIDQHVADSLAGLEVPELPSAGRIADVGSGAGFPGLPLAIALPDARVDLIEATARKCAVVDRLIEATGLRNARTVPRRAEQWGADEGREAYEAVTARAVAALPVLVEYAAPLLVEGGVLVAWKGARDAGEEAAGRAAAAELGLREATVLPVKPFKGAHSRHLHVYRKVRATPAGFPRRTGMAAKRPLR